MIQSWLLRIYFEGFQWTLAQFPWEFNWWHGSHAIYFYCYLISVAVTRVDFNKAAFYLKNRESQNFASHGFYWAFYHCSALLILFINLQILQISVDLLKWKDEEAQTPVCYLSQRPNMIKTNGATLTKSSACFIHPTLFYFHLSPATINTSWGPEFTIIYKDRQQLTHKQ